MNKKKRRKKRRRRGKEEKGKTLRIYSKDRLYKFE
jgi:hypothetical protein